jgi:hypothetical protein
MADLHIIKLCVGIQNIDHLRTVQTAKLAEARHGEGRLWHRTRHGPRRKDELLADGSLYWVIGGIIKARQNLIGFDHYVDQEGNRQCLLLLDPVVVGTAAWPHRAFQGWRYLAANDAPPDLAEGDESNDMPDEMAKELRELGLL